MVRLRIDIEDGGNITTLFERLLDPTIEAQPFVQGFQDGQHSPDDLSSGMTYPDPAANEAYDSGVNLGQATARWSS